VNHVTDTVPILLILISLRRADWPLPKLQEYLKNDTLALIGYGSQGHGQGLNARDNGINVIVGVRKNGQSWKEAIEDGWVPGKNLFPIEEAINKGTIIMNLLSDAAQSQTWAELKPLIVSALYIFKKTSVLLIYCPSMLCRRLKERLFTSLMDSLLSLRKTPASLFQMTLMSFFALPRVPEEQSDPCSRKDVVSTPQSPFGKM
jgi:hypothetical protein